MCLEERRAVVKDERMRVVQRRLGRQARRGLTRETKSGNALKSCTNNVSETRKKSPPLASVKMRPLRRGRGVKSEGGGVRR